MARQRDITKLESLTELKEQGYVLVVQDNDIFALPKSIWTNEIYKQYNANLSAWAAEFQEWYDSVKGWLSSENIPEVLANDLAKLKERMRNHVTVSATEPGMILEDGDIWIDTNTYVDLEDFSGFEMLTGTYFDGEPLPEEPDPDGGDGSDPGTEEVIQ